MKSTLLKTIVASSLLSVLAACSSDDSSSSNSGYVQLYNGSYNSPYTRLFVDDTERSGADFGDVSTRHNYSSGEYELSFEYVDANDSYINIDEETIKIKNDQTQLLVMIGDFAEPIFTELSVPTSSDEDEFNVGFFNIVGEDNLYDVYVATDDGLFDTAELLMTSQYLVEPELATLEEGYYTIYITASGSTDVIFESPTVYFNDEATYMAMIRPSYATEEDGITLDVVTASSSVTQLNHQDAQGQLRFINTIDDYTQTQFKVTRGTTATNTEVVSNDSYSEYMSMSPNSYSVAMLDEAGDTIVDNFLMTLEREQSAVGLFYNDKDYGPRMMTIEENLTPSSYSHAVTVVNLIDSYAGQEIDEVDVYFTLNGETVEDTSNVVEGLDQYDQQEQVVDNEVYTTYVVFEDNGQQIVLLQQSDMDFTEEGNYILVIEHDETTDSGFKMTLERTVTEQS